MSRTREPGSVANPKIRRLATLLVAVGPAVILPAPAALAQDGDATRLELTTDSDAAKQHFWAGVNDALNVHPPRAAMHFGMALEADPDLALALVLHGFTSPGLTGPERQARIAEGVAALAGASSNEMLVGLAFKEWASGNAPAASRLFETATELMPGDPYVASWATQLAGARGDQTDAIVRWQRLIDAFPDLANPHNSIAYQYEGRGNEAAALASVREYVELAPDHPNAADSHAELLQHAGRFPEAYAEYQRAAQLDPDYSQAYLGAAEVLFIVGAMDGAREQISLAIEHAPSAGARVAAMRALANTHMIEGARDAAMGQYRQAAAEAEGAGISGAHTISLQQMAMADAIMGDGRFVAEYLDEAAAIGGPDTPPQLAASGLAYAASGDAIMARETSDKLMEASSAPFWRNLAHSIHALALLAEDQAEAALEALEEANPGDPVTQAVLAEVYGRLERPAAAEAMREKLTGNRQVNLANPWWAFARAYVQ